MVAKRAIENARSTADEQGKKKKNVASKEKIVRRTFYSGRIYLYAFSSKFDSNGGLGLQIKFVARKSRQKIRLSDAGVANQNH